MRILIVDDSRVARSSLKKALLNLMNIQFIEADDGETALAAMKNEKPDVIFTDWYMEKMDGLELIKRTRESDKTVKICMITSEANSDRQALAYNAGADCVLNKPIKIDKLAKALEQMIG